MRLITKSRTSTAFTLRFPLCFPTMTAEDRLTIRTWCIKEGDIIQADPENPEKDMLEVIAPYGEIWISIPPFLHKAHRVVRILKPENSPVKLGDPFIELQPLENEGA
jgi:hypothetical protein